MAEAGEGVEDAGEFVAGEGIELGDESLDLGSVTVVAALGTVVVEGAVRAPDGDEGGVAVSDPLAQGLPVRMAVGARCLRGGGEGVTGICGKTYAQTSE